MSCMTHAPHPARKSSPHTSTPGGMRRTRPQPDPSTSQKVHPPPTHPAGKRCGNTAPIPPTAPGLPGRRCPQPGWRSSSSAAEACAATLAAPSATAAHTTWPPPRLLTSRRNDSNTPSTQSGRCAGTRTAARPGPAGHPQPPPHMGPRRDTRPAHTHTHGRPTQ